VRITDCQTCVFSGYQILLGIDGIRFHDDGCFMRDYMKWNITCSFLDTAGNAFTLQV
jgi:hypothetical protein